ncbi:hypothetical protein EZS27_016102 [termite gut metagenome]|uniref:Uncharacterized protein n=1 Tax=termite gut metagenome TaxID=433724 RepID=A0A5J4RQC0_9ZZZZ
MVIHLISSFSLAFKEIFVPGTVKREDIWVTSKLLNNCHAPDKVEKSCR